ncbi:hypothetical protein ACJMK2_016875 [Sinanodonta woodiana]|uniref:MULE transposase domain-containing protein n=1 Tax=Sinanodonta woodiana TaxID=1069815 RepID=A0ABD3UYJ4_SINWO
MELETVVSIRGKNKVVLNGFVYVKQKSLANNVISYECERRRGAGKNTSECRAKVKLNEDLSVVSYLNEHTHTVDSVHSEEIEETPQQIMGQELQQLSQQAAVQMVTIRHLRRNIRRVKHKKNAVHPLSVDRTFEIPEEYKSLADGENFLLYDSGCDDPNRILIFGTKRTLNLIKDSQHWFMDGTFKVIPELFFQLYTVHALVTGSIVPCLFVLLPNKTQVTYCRLFEEIKVLQPQVHPTTITMDFEKAAINAATECFANVEIHGFFFHLAQNIFRKIQSVGRQDQYQNDENFALSIWMIAALAFVPSKKVIESFKTPHESLSEEFATVMDYFEDNYIAVFDKSIWSVHSRVANSLPRINNAVERWHRKMLSAVSCLHPNTSVWSFLRILKREQSLNNVNLNQIFGGDLPEQPKMKNKDCSSRITNIVADFDNHDTIEYLKAIAYNINF